MPNSMQSREISTQCSGPESRAARARAIEQAAIELDERSSAELELSVAWQELIQGYAVVEATFFSPTRCGVILATTRRSSPPLAGRRLEIIQSILAGTSQNAIAIEMALAPSTVALHARLALEGLGIGAKPSRVHPLLMLAATIARSQSSATGSLSYLRFGERELRVVGMPRPDRKLAGLLPTAELEVVGYLLEGCCYAEIAQRRRTSERTIANQIATVFKRLRVSGRSELLLQLFVLEGAIRPAAATDLPPVPPPSAPPPATLPPTVRYPRPVALTSAEAPR